MIEFTVFGKPQPQGSIKAFMPKGWKRPILTSDNKNLKPWRQDLAEMAKFALSESDEIRWTEEPLMVSIVFTFKRPKKRKGRYKTTKPDLDKLIRAVLDGMTGIIYDDDSQVAQVIACKQYGSPERTYVRVKGAIG